MKESNFTYDNGKQLYADESLNFYKLKNILEKSGVKYQTIKFNAENGNIKEYLAVPYGFSAGDYFSKVLDACDSYEEVGQIRFHVITEDGRWNWPAFYTEKKVFKTMEDVFDGDGYFHVYPNSSDYRNMIDYLYTDYDDNKFEGIMKYRKFEALMKFCNENPSLVYACDAYKLFHNSKKVLGILKHKIEVMESRNE